jgi:hypothetical protein
MRIAFGIIRADFVVFFRHSVVSTGMKRVTLEQPF